MIYAEASYFEGYAFAHVAAYEEALRLRRINEDRRRRTRARRSSLAREL